MSKLYIINWLLEHQEAILILAAIATGIGALYQPMRDLFKALPKFVWDVAKCTFMTIWVIIWPIRKPISWAYTKFLSDHVYNFIDVIFDWFGKREIAKEKILDNKNIIEVTDL